MVNPVFSQDRNVELSTIRYIETEIDANWSDIEVVKGWPNFDKVALPVVSVYLASQNAERKEIGSRSINDIYTFIIDIFAKSDGQRIDLADSIKNSLLDDWTYYTHSQTSGTPKVLSRVDAGRVIFLEFVQNIKVEFADGADGYDRFRHQITFNARIRLD
jgi:hypothetical protein